MSIPLNQILQALFGAASLTGLGIFLYANQLEVRQYRLETLAVSIAGRQRAGSGIERSWRILHLSDLHLCHPESHKLEFLKQATDDDYDLVVLTGDIFENFTGLAYADQILSRQPRLGAYAVLGNHDYYNYTLFNKTIGRLKRSFRQPARKRDVAPMILALSKAGFQVMRNSAATLDGLHIVGIDYPSVDKGTLEKLVKQAADDQCVLTLFHQPIHLDRICATGSHLALGGHTHGGQIRLPGWGAIVTDSELPPKQASGLFQIEQTLFHISRGIGADPRSNIRLFCPPAATILEVTYKV